MAYKAVSKTLSYNTKSRLEFITITKEVQKFVESSGVYTGTITLQTHHTTAGLWVNEDEKNLIGPEDTLGYKPDLKRILDRFAHPGEEYGHNDIQDPRNPKGKRNTHLCEPDENGIIQECVNGHAHAHNMVIQSHVALIIEKGKLLLGVWQQVMLVELDHDRPRTLTMVAQGDTEKS